MVEGLTEGEKYDEIFYVALTTQQNTVENEDNTLCFTQIKFLHVQYSRLITKFSNDMPMYSTISHLKTILKLVVP